MGGSTDGSSSPNAGMPPPCEECGENPWKYRCPGCSIRTCSLPCVKSHKQRTACTGQRNRTGFIPLSRFGDSSLLSDFNFLEDAKRIAESARRVRSILGGRPWGFRWRPGRFRRQPDFKLPFKLRMLRNAAFRRRARLLLQPAGMSRREKNQSRYDRSVDERLNLTTIMEKHLKPTPWNHPLRPFCNEELDSLKFFLQKNPKDPKSHFRELNVMLPIGQQMEGITIVEHPIILIFLPSHRYDFGVELPGRPSSLHTAPKHEDHRPGGSPVGTSFKEEEPEEDGESSDPRILDLMDYSIRERPGNSSLPESTSAAPSDHAGVPAWRAGGSAAAAAGGPEETWKNVGCRGDEPPPLPDDIDFDFEQDLRDAFSDLVGEINPDDFLCFDGDCPVAPGMETTGEVGGYPGRGLAEDDELEEGEIRDCR